MDYSVLKLHIVQAGRSLERASSNNYSDKEKQDYHKCLVNLYESAISIVETQQVHSDTLIKDVKQLLDFIYKSLEFLDSSTINLIPYETVEGLKTALKDWTDPKDKYIIVTSLINQIYGFSFDPTLVEVDGRYQEFKQKYNVNFTSKLVQINIPRALSRDYLASVAHYHELGHFIDKRFVIVDSICRQLLFEIKNNSFNVSAIVIYFPFLSLNYSDGDLLQLLNYHLGEYFCDLFASQYVGFALSEYLLYITEEQQTYSITHPASVNRKAVVQDFLQGKDNLIVKIINYALKQITGKELEIRHEEPIIDDVFNFLPPVIHNEKQLHGILPMAWKVWQGDWVLFQQNMNMNTTINPDKVYLVLNNLIEKSIGNYIVERKWNSQT